MDETTVTTRATVSSDKVNGMGLRCHKFESDGWFHATVPTVREVVACAGEPGPMIELADKHIFISQSSFADYELQTIGDLPYLLFGPVMQALLEHGRPAMPNGQCHR